MDLLDRYIAKFGPAAQAAGETAEAYARATLSELRRINTQLEQEEWSEVRRDFPVSIGAADGRYELAQVPTGQIWILEAWGGLGPAASNVVLRSSGVYKSGFAGAAGAPFYRVDDRLMFQGGEVLTVESSTQVEMSLQMKVRTKLPRSKAIGAGTREPGADDKPELDLGARHVGVGVFQGDNVRGERAPERRP